MKYILIILLFTLFPSVASCTIELDCNLAFIKLFKQYRKTEIKSFRDMVMNPQKIIPYLDRFDRRLTIKEESFLELLKLNKDLESFGLLSDIEQGNHSHYLAIDLENSTSTELIRYLKRSSKRFGTDQLTFSFFENIKNHSKGFSIGNRIDLGILSADDLINNKLNSTVEHELTHQLFKEKREQGIASVFHGSIDANTKLIHNSKVFSGYKKYLNLEELYTWSKDMTNAKNLAVYFEKSQALSVLASAVTKQAKKNVEVFSKVIKKIKKLEQNQISQISKRDLSIMGIDITTFNVLVTSHGLITNMPIVSKNMKELNSLIFSTEDSTKDIVYEIPILINFLRKVQEDKERAIDVFEHIQKLSDSLMEKSATQGVELSELIKDAHALKRDINEDYKGFIGRR